MKIIAIIIFSLFIIHVNGQGSLLNKINRINKKLPGQTAPNDMVFIQGNDSIPSFYIGVTEESNLNYVIYLNWLIHVYSGDYPEIVLAALPHKSNGEKACSFDDSHIKNYLMNPVLSHSPAGQTHTFFSNKSKIIT
ncbi:MAG: hypothetical protein COA97_11400 [Flavobacteriales bacterium]|nr:MAG: hypothetical protein COA97_11400 [Flavobacteriales bacterium]